MINVLIVDDDMATVEVVRNTVHWEQLGVSSVDKAYNIEQAKKFLLSKNIDLVISDVEMPMGSGLDLLRWFREQEMEGEFLLLTCHEDFSYASEALHNRAAEYLLKPFDVNVMEVALRRIIMRIKEQRALKSDSRLGEWVRNNYSEVQLSFWNSVLEGRFEGKATIAKNFPQAMVTECEGAPIAQIAHDVNVPFIIIRSVSDCADENETKTYDFNVKVASENSAKLVLAMIKML